MNQMYLICYLWHSVFKRGTNECKKGQHWLDLACLGRILIRALKRGQPDIGLLDIDPSKCSMFVCFCNFLMSKKWFHKISESQMILSILWINTNFCCCSDLTQLLPLDAHFRPPSIRQWVIILWIHAITCKGIKHQKDFMQGLSDVESWYY